MCYLYIFVYLYIYKPTFSVVFCSMKKLHVSSQFNSLFILYISTAKSFSLLVRGYIHGSDDKRTRNPVSFDPANSEMSKIYQGNFQSSCRLAQLFLDTSAVILQKKSEIVGENFFPALKMRLVDFIEIRK